MPRECRKTTSSSGGGAEKPGDCEQLVGRPGARLGRGARDRGEAACHSTPWAP
jgi:hypothetical protein